MAHKDRKHKHFPPDFTLTLHFHDPSLPSTPSRDAASHPPLPAGPSPRHPTSPPLPAPPATPAPGPPSLFPLRVCLLLPRAHRGKQHQETQSSPTNHATAWFERLVLRWGTPARYARGATIAAAHPREGHVAGDDQSFFYITRGAVEAVIHAGSERSVVGAHGHHHHAPHHHHHHHHHHPHGSYVPPSLEQRDEQVPCVGVRGAGAIIAADAFLLRAQGVEHRARTQVVEGYHVSAGKLRLHDVDGVGSSGAAGPLAASDASRPPAALRSSGADKDKDKQAGGELRCEQCQYRTTRGRQALAMHVFFCHSSSSKSRERGALLGEWQKKRLLGDARNAPSSAPADAGGELAGAGPVVGPGELAEFYRVLGLDVGRQLLRLRTEVERMLSLRALSCQSAVMQNDDEKLQVLNRKP